MKKVFVLAIASASLIACNNTETPSINDDTRDNSTVVTEPASPTTTAYVPVDGDVAYRDHKVHVYRNGAWVEAEEDVKLDDGIIVYRNGKVKKDDDVVVLEDGEVVNKNGEFFDKAGQKIENAWDDTKEGASKVGDKIEKGADKVKDKAHDAVENEHDEDKK